MKSASPVARNLGRWVTVLDLDRDGPVFLRIARAITEAIRGGRLLPGARLPGARTLALELQVHRNTVIAAYDELVAEGWLQTRPARGTFVAEAPTRIEVPARRRAPSGLALRPWPIDSSSAEPETVGARPSSTIVLDGGTPDLRLVPTTALARAYRRALGKAEHLGYAADGRGHARLRAMLATMLSETRGLHLEADDVLVTRGSQGALDLVARAWVRPGDRVAIEALGYPPVRAIFELAGAELVPIPVDEHGLDIDTLARAQADAPLRAVVLTPHHHYPTTVALAPWRRIELLSLASRSGFAVIEDDYDHEFHYRGRPLLPLKASDEHGVVVYIGTLSKLVAPGLRVGWIVAPPPLSQRLALLRGLVERHGDPAMEAALADLFEDGEIQRHTRRMRKVYAERREVLLEAIETQLGGYVSVTPSHGGMALWVTVTAPRLVSLHEAWLDRAAARGVIVQRAHGFVAAGPVPAAFRIGFARARPDELRLAVKRLRLALDDVMG